MRQQRQTHLLLPNFGLATNYVFFTLSKHFLDPLNGSFVKISRVGFSILLDKIPTVSENLMGMKIMIPVDSSNTFKVYFACFFV